MCPFKSCLHNPLGILAGFEEAAHPLCFEVEVLLCAANVSESLELGVWFAISGGGWVAGAVKEIQMGIGRFVRDGGGEFPTVWVDRDEEVQERDRCVSERGIEV